MVEYFVYGIFTDDATLGPDARGIAARKLEIVRIGDLCAVVSEAEEVGVGTDVPKAFLEYQHALSMVTARSALPARFGARLPDRAAVASLLERCAHVLRAELTRLTGLAQFNLSASWNLAHEIQRAATDAEIVAARAELAARGNITPEDQARVGAMIGRVLEHGRARLEALTMQALESVRLECGTVPRQDETNAFNITVLARGADRAEIERRLNALSDELEGRLRFTLSGPLPTLAFAALELIVPSAAELESARAALELPAQQPADAQAVRRAYRKLALEHHPDRRPDNAEAGAQMRRLTLARELLETAGSGLGVRVMKAVA